MIKLACIMHTMEYNQRLVRQRTPKQGLPAYYECNFVAPYAVTIYYHENLKLAGTSPLQAVA
jgi:hypothetical protein